MHKSFGPVVVLRDVHFDLKSGEVHVLAGENGAGKSTLMKILGGVLTDYDGTIELDGQAVRMPSVQVAAAHGIAIMHQDLSLVGSLSVYENIFLGREMHCCSWVRHGQMKQRARALLEELGIYIAVEQPVGRLPIGLQQMVEIAKALSYHARIIVMDEPTSALSEPEVEKLFAIIAQLKNKGCGIVYITHKMEEIYRIADRITVLRDGAYIGTESVVKLPADKLVNWMVGRTLNQQFPRHQANLGAVRLKASGITLPGPAESPALLVSKVSFQVRAGEILGMAGLQGSGNSELLHGIFGSYGTRVQGILEIDGERASMIDPARSIRKGLALLTNDRKTSGLVLQLDILHNASLASLNRVSPWGWLRPAKEKESVAETARLLRIKAQSLRQPVNALSGGNQQKVALAKWIRTEPKVLLLDEPTRGVDIGAKHEIYELMNQWTQQGMAVVWITSELPELLAMSDRIVVMHRGCITAEFSGAEATQEKILNAALGDMETMRQ